MRHLNFLLLLTLTSATAFASTTIHKPRSTGSDYLIVFPGAAYGNRNVGVLANAPMPQTMTLTSPTGSPSTIAIDSPRTQRAIFGGFAIADTPGYYRRIATRIQSNGPMSLVGQYGTGGISGTFTPLPVKSWGTEYYAIVPPEGENSGYSGYPAIYSAPMITIIACHAGTSVTITPTAATAKGNPQDVPFTVSLASVGDVYVVSTAGFPGATSHHEDACNADLTGTHIESNYPVGVLVSQTHGSWPCGKNDCGDYGVEWLPPVANWDTVYVIVPSIPGAGVSDQVRIAFAHDDTQFSIDDASGKRDLGTYVRGDWIDIPPALTTPVVLHASHAFLPMIITPTNNAQCPSGGVATGWSFGMTFIHGVDQWSDFTPFATAIGSQSSASILFRYADSQRVRLNGRPLWTLSPPIIRAPLGFAVFHPALTSGTYYELTCDSGATAGGVIFGMGTSAYEIGGNAGDEPDAYPKSIKSFAHPIGGDMLPLANPDITPPHLVMTYSGAWDGDAFDDELNPPATGIYEISLVQWPAGDSSYNVQFTAQPRFSYGDSRVAFAVGVINQFLPARGTLSIVDGAGNEFDTVLVYMPPEIELRPPFVDVGAVAPLTTATATVTMINHSSYPVSIQSYRLRGSSKHWSILKPPSAATPFMMTQGDSANLAFRYAPPDANGPEDVDTVLFVMFGAEFPGLVVRGRPKTPVITTTLCHDFGASRADTLGFPGDTVRSGRGLWVSNIGGDTLTVSGVSILGDPGIAEPGFPATDFHVLRAFDRIGTNKLLPSASAPWNVAPGDTVFVEVAAHPHHTGARAARLVYANDARGALRDTTCLTSIGTVPTGIAEIAVPFTTTLAENYPNPAQSSTTIVLPRTGTYRVHIANMLGEEIAVLRGHDARTLSWSTAALTRGVYRYVVIDEALGVAVARGSVVVR